MILRDYQQRGVDAAIRELTNGARSTLIIAATGLGKTVIFSHIAKHFAEKGRVLILAHREELIRQAANKIKAITGETPEIEMADERANENNDHPWISKYIIASVPSLKNKKRLERFDHAGFSLVIVDECFVAGTLVDGRPIESIRVGDWVKSFDHSSQKIERRRVAAIFKSRPAAIVRVSLADGREFRCTAGHPFYTQHGYVAAGCLRRDHVIFGSSQDRNLIGVGVDRIEILERTSDGTFGGMCPDGFVYNLEVEDNHNYFVGGVLVHNCHHGVAETYRRIIDHFKQNPSIGILGVTATGDRGDGEGLGSIFESIAFAYELPDAIADGWLVPVKQRSVIVEGLDFSKCKTTAGDLNQGDLAAVMEFEESLHPVAHATIELAGGLDNGSLLPLRDDDHRQDKIAEMLCGRPLRKTLVFTVSVKQAERLAEIFNRWLDKSARFVCGSTLPEDRKLIFSDFKAGNFSILVNVGVATEGFDEPGLEVVVMARPTKSRALFAQMAGRATRPIEAIAAQLGTIESAEQRRQLIVASDKPAAEILDFVGNTGKHRLITMADILSGDWISDGVIERANEIASEQSIDVSEAVRVAEEEEYEANRAMAEAQGEFEDRQAEREAEAAERARLIGTTNYVVQEVGGDRFRSAPDRKHVAIRGGATEPQIRFLVSLGVDRATAMSYSKRQAGAVISSLKNKTRSSR